MIAATQRPSAALVGGMMKANFPVRLVGSVTSPEDAKVAAGIAGTEAERLLGRGDFLLIAKGQTIRFQAAYAPDAELETIVAQVRSGGRRTRAWLAAESPYLRSEAMKKAIVPIMIAFGATLAVIIGQRMSTDAMAVVIGVAVGVAASVPTSLLLVALLRRQRQEGWQERACRSRRLRNCSPPTSSC